MTDSHRRHAQPEARRRISEQAAAWYLDLHDEPGAALRAEFLAWLKHSPAHVAEYLAIARLHGYLPAVAALETHDAQQLDALAATESLVIPLRRAPAPPAGERTLPATARPARRYRAVGAWMGIAAAAMVAVVLIPPLAPAPLPAAVTYATDADATRSIALPDGSLVQLDRDSAIAVRFDARQRDIDLLHGSAVFDIGKDALRPLQVRVGANLLRDIGTVFSVQQLPDGHSVTVLSGRVDLSMQPTRWQAFHARLAGGHGAGAVLASLGGGQQAVVNEQGAVMRTENRIDAARATTWLPRDIHFDDTPIGDVARRFNAYTTRPIVIRDPAVAAIRISGRFHANDPDSFLLYLSAMPGISVQRDTDAVRIQGAHRL